MFVSTACPKCFRPLTYPTQVAGKQATCSACGATLTVPALEPAMASAPAPAVGHAAASATVANAPVTGVAPSGASFGLVPPMPDVREDDGADLVDGGFGLPTAAQPTDAPHVRAVGFELWCLDRSILGGAGLILAAIAWFVIGWWCGYIFFYPPILAVLGIAAILKSVLGGDSLT